MILGPHWHRDQVELVQSLKYGKTRFALQVSSFQTDFEQDTSPFGVMPFSRLEEYTTMITNFWDCRQYRGLAQFPAKPSCAIALLPLKPHHVFCQFIHFSDWLLVHVTLPQACIASPCSSHYTLALNGFCRSRALTTTWFLRLLGSYLQLTPYPLWFRQLKISTWIPHRYFRLKASKLNVSPGPLYSECYHSLHCDAQVEICESLALVSLSSTIINIIQYQ